MTTPTAAGPSADAPGLRAAAPRWWRRPGLDVLAGRLSLNGADLEALARERATPLFVYDLARPVETVRALQAALDRAGMPHLVRFALKANPDPRILAVLRGLAAPGSRAAKDWDAAADLAVALWIDGVGQPAGRAPNAVRALVRAMTLETYFQEKAYGRPIVLDPPAAERLAETRVPLLVIDGELIRQAPTRPRMRSWPASRAPSDRRARGRAPVQPRAAGLVHGDAAVVPRRRPLTGRPPSLAPYIPAVAVLSSWKHPQAGVVRRQIPAPAHEPRGSIHATILASPDASPTAT